MIKKRLKLLRGERDINQRELARVLKLSASTIGMYETGQRTPDADTLQRIADYFNTTVDYLLGRTENRKVSDPALDNELNQIMRDLGPDVTLQFYDLKGMSDDEKENLIIFLQGLKARREQKKEK